MKPHFFSVVDQLAMKKKSQKQKTLQVGRCKFPKGGGISGLHPPWGDEESLFFSFIFSFEEGAISETGPGEGCLNCAIWRLNLFLLGFLGKPGF
jgi:hypothetical protein